jgi:dolichyl-phosphate beta-glucosyltransferase
MTPAVSAARAEAGTPALSVVIPAYNEAERLAPHLGPILAYLHEHYPDFELIVVDDGSTDDTAPAIADALAGQPRARVLTYQPNHGKGYAIRTGVLASSGQALVFLDADLSTPIEEIPAALAHLQQADIVIGSRDLPSSECSSQFSGGWPRKYLSGCAT